MASTMSMFDSSVREERPVACICAQQCEALALARRLALQIVSTAEPKPNQPGSATRHWPQLKLHGMARRSSIARVALREAGREPILSSAISAIGVAPKK